MSKVAALANSISRITHHQGSLSSSSGLLQRFGFQHLPATCAAWLCSNRWKGSLVVQESTPVMARNLLVDTLNLVQLLPQEFLYPAD